LPAGRFDRQARTARLQRIVGRRHSFVAPPGKTLAEQLAVERRVFVRRSTTKSAAAARRPLDCLVGRF